MWRRPRVSRVDYGVATGVIQLNQRDQSKRLTGDEGGAGNMISTRSTKEDEPPGPMPIGGKVVTFVPPNVSTVRAACFP
jgi:hypothetical protein